MACTREQLAVQLLRSPASRSGGVAVQGGLEAAIRWAGSADVARASDYRLLLLLIEDGTSANSRHARHDGAGADAIAAACRSAPLSLCVLGEAMRAGRCRLRRPVGAASSVALRFCRTHFTLIMGLCSILIIRRPARALPVPHAGQRKRSSVTSRAVLEDRCVPEPRDLTGVPGDAQLGERGGDRIPDSFRRLGTFPTYFMRSCRPMRSCS
jgi:hypothetical protein